jgi:hypothetical protein
MQNISLINDGQIVPDWVMRCMIAALLALLLLAPLLTDVAAEDEDAGKGVWCPVIDAPEFSTAPPQRLADGSILASVRPLLIYDPYAGAWTEGSSHHDFREFSEFPQWSPQRGMPLDDDTILAFGGGYAHGVSPGSTGVTSQAATYDLSTDSWRDVGRMNSPRFDPGAVRLDDGSIFVSGGRYGSGISGSSGWYVNDSTERFIPETGEWVETAPMNESRRLHETTLLGDGRVVVIGGHGAMYAPASAIEVYDPENDYWEIIGRLPELRTGHTATLLPDGEILIAGGSPNRRGTNEEPVQDALLLNPITGELSEVEPMNIARANHQATLLPDGNVLVTGGWTGVALPRVITESTEIYDVDSGEWKPGPELTSARSSHLAVALEGETQGAAVMVYGGVSDRTEDRWAEVYYPEFPGIADRQPPPADDDPAHRYFPAIGHYLSHGFKDFWDASGGLPVFGYPLTTEFDEFNSELDEHRTSQYFQRQRFE